MSFPLPGILAPGNHADTVDEFPLDWCFLRDNFRQGRNPRLAQCFLQDILFWAEGFASRIDSMQHTQIPVPVINARILSCFTI